MSTEYKIHAEEWRPVEGYLGLYEVSSLGRVRSLERHDVYQDARLGLVTRTRRGKIMRAGKDRTGYWAVTLSDEGERKRILVSALVARAFIGPRPEGHQVCHNDGNKDNNAASNLRYDTPKGNMADAIAQGRMPRGETNKSSKLTADDVRAIRALKGKLTCKQIAALFGIGHTSAHNIVTGRTWRHV